MARAAVAAALFLFLTVAFVNTSDLPPVDQDGSGDDDDSFSGSGFEPLLEEEFAHGDSAAKPTDASLTSAVPYVPTENQHPIVEPERPEENEAGTVSTTSAVVTELIPSPGQPEQDDNIPDEETAADKGSAVFIVPTTGPTVQPDTVKMDVSHDIVPEVHNIPQAQTTESVKHATDTIVDPAHHDGTSTTEATEPHKHHHHHSHPPHHHHHHHHHHNHTTAASVTEAVDTDLHHVPHHRTSAPSVTRSLDPHLHPAIQEDIRPTSAVDPHMGHPHDADHVTEGNVEPHSSTPDANLLEDLINETTTIGISHDNNRKTNIPVVVFEPESEPEHTDSPEFEASGGSLDTNDFVFEPSIPRAHVPDNKIEVEDDGMSDTSKGIMEQKGVLAAVIAGGVAGLVFAICLVGFMLYRMKKKDEGSYCLEETKQTNGGYEKPLKQEEFYA